MLYCAATTYLMGVILALKSIRQHNYSCKVNSPVNEFRMSQISALASWMYFIVEYRAFGIGELPDDLVQIANEEAVPDCSKHFDNHLFID